LDKWDVELARLLKERNNRPNMGVVIGKVIRELPDLLVSIGDEIILDEELLIANRIYSLALLAGDQLILMPSSDGQTFYVMDKVGE